MFRILSVPLAFLAISATLLSQSSPTGKPAAHVLGTIVAMDAGTHTVTVKDDKSSTTFSVDVTNTKTLLKVLPGAKDLTTATRITADQLLIGDRIDVRGSEVENTPNAIAARSVVLMSGRDLAKVHAAEAAAWQNSIAGRVMSVDAASNSFTVSLPTPPASSSPAGPATPLQVNAAAAVVFTRYSPNDPNTPAPSKLSDIQAGDQVRVLGERSADGQSVTAQKVYSGAFRTVEATVTSISPDGKQITIKNLETKQSMDVILNDGTTIRKLPPMMAMGLARRFNPSYQAASPGSANQATPSSAPAAGAGNNGGTSAAGMHRGSAGDGASPGAGQWNGGNVGNSAPGEGGMRRGGGAGGSLSQILERAPKIVLTDLKPGDALVISGASDTQFRSKLVARNIIAGVEPIFQSASSSRSGSLGDWNTLDMAVPTQ